MKRQNSKHRNRDQADKNNGIGTGTICDRNVFRVPAPFAPADSIRVSPTIRASLAAEALKESKWNISVSLRLTSSCPFTTASPLATATSTHRTSSTLISGSLSLYPCLYLYRGQTKKKAGNLVGVEQVLMVNGERVGWLRENGEVKEISDGKRAEPED